MALQEPGLRIDISHLDGCVRVALTGELDIATAGLLHEGLLPLTRRYDADQVTLDCAALTFVDVYGVGRLVDALRRFGDTGRAVVQDASPWLLQLLRLLEVDGLVRLDLQDA